MTATVTSLTNLAEARTIAAAADDATMEAAEARARADFAKAVRASDRAAAELCAVFPNMPGGYAGAREVLHALAQVNTVSDYERRRYTRLVEAFDAAEARCDNLRDVVNVARDENLRRNRARNAARWEQQLATVVGIRN